MASQKVPEPSFRRRPESIYSRFSATTWKDWMGVYSEKIGDRASLVRNDEKERFLTFMMPSLLEKVFLCFIRVFHALIHFWHMLCSL